MTTRSKSVHESTLFLITCDKFGVVANVGLILQIRLTNNTWYKVKLCPCFAQLSLHTKKTTFIHQYTPNRKTYSWNPKSSHRCSHEGKERTPTLGCLTPGSPTSMKISFSLPSIRSGGGWLRPGTLFLCLTHILEKFRKKFGLWKQFLANFC